MVKHKVLFVDDEVNALSAFKRLFFNNDDIDIFTASGGTEGLKILGLNEIDLVISDMKMPELNGSDFLKYVKNKYPHVLRIMLTAYADISSALDAINKGEVYRFLTKPWNDDDLKITILNALEYSDLKKRNEEMSKVIWKKNRELTVLNESLEHKVEQRTVQIEQVIDKLKKVNVVLRQNFDEIINLLTGIISLFQKDLAAHSKRVAALSAALCDELVIGKDEKEIITHAAFLHDVGMLGATEEIFTTELEQLDEKGKNFFLYHPIIGEKIIGAVKSLSKISNIIRSHHEEYNGTGFPDNLRGSHIPLGSQIIKITSDYDTYRFSKGRSFEESVGVIKEGSYKSYNPDIIKSFVKIVTRSSAQKHSIVIRVRVKDLKAGMYLLDEIMLENGVLLIPSGVVVDNLIRKKIVTFSSLLQLEREIEVKYIRAARK
ncbi:MAG: response regulator [Spirochaetes bacterium]|nr:response regulator [Spirochaetota bacterium]